MICCLKDEPLGNRDKVREVVELFCLEPMPRDDVRDPKGGRVAVAGAR